MNAAVDEASGWSKIGFVIGWLCGVPFRRPYRLYREMETATKHQFDAVPPEIIYENEARVTMAQVKALNKRLSAARTSAERESIRSLIAAAKVGWFDRVSGELVGRQQAQQSEFFRQRAASSYL